MSEPSSTPQVGLAVATRWLHSPEILAVVAGWAVALAVMLPVLPAGDPPARSAALLSLMLALLWWAAAVIVIRSDLRDFIIPDGASIVIAICGLVRAMGVPALMGDGPIEAGAATLAALAVGGGAFALFWFVGLLFRSTGRDALGFGDVKLAGASAVWLSVTDAVVALEVAALAAIAMLLVSRFRATTEPSVSLRDMAMPFGAVLAPTAWLVFVFGPALRDSAAFAAW